MQRKLPDVLRPLRSGRVLLGNLVDTRSFVGVTLPFSQIPCGRTHVKGWHGRVGVRRVETARLWRNFLLLATGRHAQIHGEGEKHGCRMGRKPYSVHHMQWWRKN